VFKGNKGSQEKNFSKKEKENKKKTLKKTLVF
jgi:hypothetical protein